MSASVVYLMVSASRPEDALCCLGDNRPREYGAIYCASHLNVQAALMRRLPGLRRLLADIEPSTTGALKTRIQRAIADVDEASP